MRRIIVVSIFFAAIFAAKAQTDTTSTDSEVFNDIKASPEFNITATDQILGQDSTKNGIVTLDSLDSPTPPDSVANKPKNKRNDIETTINYHARDSMVFEIGNRRLFMYGDTHIDYGSITLKSNQTSIDWNERQIKSEYTLDSLGRKRGKPIFSDRGDSYETDNILYNFKTKRAIIKGVVTEQDGAIMHGADVKKNEENELFIKDAKYTTCNLADPHFFIKSQKIKVIPGNKVLSGPFNLKFREVPTPLWFPFGMFPQPREKASGIIFPSYGEETRRGFFLRDGGYYFGFSDFYDLRLTGDIYSKGGYAFDATSNYKVRYKFNGALNFTYNKNIVETAEAPQETNDFWIRWNHRPETRGNSSFSASVNGGSRSFNENNNVAINNPSRSISSEFQSSLSYNQRFRRLPMNMSMNFRHRQNIQSGIYNMTLPDFAMNINRIYPFKKIVKSSKSPLAKISFSHNFNAKNEFSNAPLSTSSYGFNVVNEGSANEDTLQFNIQNLSEIYDRAKIGGRHTIPISTSFNAFKFFTVSPSFNYQEVWYTRELQYTEVPEENGVRVDTVEGFSRAGSWSSGASMNTRLYGMYYLKNIAGIEAIRHVMTPSLSFSYNPDFGDEKYGVYQTIQTDSLGTTRRVSKYQNFAYGSPTGSESRTLGFSLTNNLEMKIRDKKDSVNEFKKVKIFDNLSMNTGYNFAADSFKLRNIGWNARTSFFQQKVNVTLSGNFDPYLYVDDGTEAGDKVDRYAWNNGQGLGTLRTLTSAINFSLKGKKTSDSQADRDRDQQLGGQNDLSPFANDGSLIDDSEFGTEEEKAYIKANPEEYVDFNVPWSLRVGYNISRSKNGLAEQQISSHGVQFSGTLGLTDKTQITFNSGYDIKNADFTQTRIGVTRDLHCWSLNFNWVPFGRFQSFSLVIRPKSAILQDLKLEKRRSFQDFFGQ
ncbi:MAG: LPS-assembly protein LptD [Cyclobacteriaceae bacterium]